MPTVIAAIFSAVIFGIMHGEIIWMLYTFAVGLMLVWVFEKTKSLLACIVVHAANNGLSQLTENIPENSVAMEYVILIVSLVILVVAVTLLIAVVLDIVESYKKDGFSFLKKYIVEIVLVGVIFTLYEYFISKSGETWVHCFTQAAIIVCASRAGSNVIFAKQKNNQ